MKGRQLFARGHRLKESVSAPLVHRAPRCLGRGGRELRRDEEEEAVVDDTKRALENYGFRESKWEGRKKEAKRHLAVELERGIPSPDRKTRR